MKMNRIFIRASKMMRKVAQFGFADHLTLTVFHVLQEMDAERKVWFTTHLGCTSLQENQAPM